MIYEMSRSLETLMRERSYPVAVVYGPELEQRHVGPHTGVIVIERDRQAPDALTAPRGVQRNARKVFTWEIAARATVFVRSQLAGAHAGDHERECERFVRGLIAALYRWSGSERAGPINVTGLGMLEADELEQFANAPPAGCAYVIQFRVPTGLTDLEYTPESEGTAGGERPTGTPTGVSNDISLSLIGGAPDPGCGPLP